MSSTPIPRTQTGLVARTYHKRMNCLNSPENWSRLPPRPPPEKFPFRKISTRGRRCGASTLPQPPQKGAKRGRKRNTKLTDGQQHLQQTCANKGSAKTKEGQEIRNVERNKPHQGKTCRNVIQPKKKIKKKWDSYRVDGQIQHKYGSKERQEKAKSKDSSLSYIRQSANRRMYLKELQTRLDFELAEEERNDGSIEELDMSTEKSMPCSHNSVNQDKSLLVQEIRKVKESIFNHFLVQMKDEPSTTHSSLTTYSSMTQNNQLQVRGMGGCNSNLLEQVKAQNLNTRSRMEGIERCSVRSCDRKNMYVEGDKYTIGEVMTDGLKESEIKITMDPEVKNAKEGSSPGETASSEEFLLQDDASLWSCLSNNQRLRIHKRVEDIRRNAVEEDSRRYKKSGIMNEGKSCGKVSTLNEEYESLELKNANTTNLQSELGSSKKELRHINDKETQRQNILAMKGAEAKNMDVQRKNDKLNKSSPTKKTQITQLRNEPTLSESCCKTKSSLREQQASNEFCHRSPLCKNGLSDNVNITTTNEENNAIANCVADIVSVIADDLLASITTSMNNNNEEENNNSISILENDMKENDALKQAKTSFDATSSQTLCPSSRTKCFPTPDIRVLHTAAEIQQPHPYYELPLQQNIRDSMKLAIIKK